MRSWPIQRRLTVILALLACIPLTLTGAIVLQQAQDEVTQQTRTHLLGIVRALDGNLPADFLRKMNRDIPALVEQSRPGAFREMITPTLQKTAQDHTDVTVGFYAAQYQMAYSMLNGTAQAMNLAQRSAEESPAFSARFGDTPQFSPVPIHDGYLYTYPIVRDGVTLCYAYAIFPTAPVMQAMAKMRFTILSILGATLLAVWWAARWLAQYLIKTVFTATEQVAAGHPTAVVTTEPEFAPLVELISQMFRQQADTALDLLNSLPFGINVFDQDMILTYTNRFHADLCGVNPADLVGLPHPDYIQRYLSSRDYNRLVTPVVSSGGSSFARQRQTMINASGEEIPVEVVAIPFHDPREHRRRTLVLIYDQRMDQDLAQTRRTMAFLNDAIPIGTMILNADGTIAEYNRAMSLMAQIPREQAMGRTMDQLFPDIPMETRLDQLVLVQGKEYRNFAVRCTLGGKSRDVLVDTSLIRDQRGHTAGAIILIRDITQLRSMERQLHGSVQQAQFFLETVDIGVIAVDAQGRVSVINHVAEQAAGCSFAQAINQDITKLAITSELLTPLMDGINGSKHRNHLAVWDVGGEKHTFIIDSSPLYDADKAIDGAMAVFRDITVIRKLELEVQRSEKLSVIGQLAAGTAHEIRNPLTTVRGFLQVLREKCGKHEWVQEISYIDLMLSEIDRINQVISEFLMLSKDRQPNLRPLELGTMVRDIGAILESEALLRGIRLNVNLPEQPMHILADREQFKQVLLNIATNAFQAMSSGGQLNIAIRPVGASVAVAFTDTGCGIPAEVLPRIFDPFFTTKEEGTGLGLAICNRIMHDHRGEIKIDSEPGQGTTVTVVLPLMKS